MCRWLSYYFYKVVFFNVVSLPLFILQHNRIQKVNSRVGAYIPDYTELHCRHRRIS